MFRQILKGAPEDFREHYSQSHLTKGSDYHSRFSSLPGRALMWRLEQNVLQSVVRELRPKRVLDFATGTGRIAGVIRRSLPNAEMHGIDISEAMLNEARENFPGINFHVTDGRRANQLFAPGYFDLVCAFRFFPNADDLLREDAADQIAELTANDGFVLFNNHRNFWSLSYLGRRLLSHGAEGALNRDLEDLFAARGFERVKRYSLGVWPQTEARSFLLPWIVTGLIERANLATGSTLHGLGYNTIWVMRKKSSRSARKRR